MKKFYFFLLLTLSFHLTLLAESQGEALERQLWANFKARNYSSIERHMSKDFQSVQLDGSRNREQELALIRQQEVGDYKLTDFKVSESNGVIVVSYLVGIAEIIDKDKSPTKPSPRLSVWQNFRGNWEWIAHANLNSMTQPITTIPQKSNTGPAKKPHKHDF